MSSIHPSLGGQVGALYTRTDPSGVGNVDGQRQAGGPGQTRPGAGALADRQIRVGDGQTRSDTLSHADRAKAFFKTAGKVLAGIVLAPVAVAGALVGAAAVLGTRAVLQIPRLINQQVLEPISDKRFEAANQATLAKLRTPMQDSIARDPAVMDRLEAHANAMGTPLSGDQIRELVAVGERLAQGLTTGQGTPDASGMFEVPLDDSPAIGQAAGGSPLTLHVDGEAVKVESNVYTTRALGWYMMAAAGRQDEHRAQAGDTSGRSDMVTSGSFVMKDPGNAIYRFLAAAPTADSRMSTHFGERVDHDEQHFIAGLIPSGKPAQRGIEDYRNMLPGQGGTMLFDKLAGTGGSQELFVKFESVGCPPYFRNESHQVAGQGVARFFAALDRNIHHGTNFLDSKIEALLGHGGGVKRQEHVYKGVLAKSVAQPFAKLIDSAVRSGVIDAEAKQVSRSVHKFGMPFIEAALNRIEEQATFHGNQGVLRELEALRGQIDQAIGELGAQSDHHGIERRGAEVHISMNPADNRAG